MKYASLVFSFVIILAGTYDKLFDANTDLIIKIIIAVVLWILAFGIGILYWGDKNE